MEEEDDFKGLWDRVISPTIQMKYVTVRCNLNNEVQKTYKSKSQCKLVLTILAVVCSHLHIFFIKLYNT